MADPGTELQPTALSGGEEEAVSSFERAIRVRAGAWYASLDTFYAANPARAVSGEYELGTRWRDGTCRRSRYRIAWIEHTGELYSHAQSELEFRSRVELLAIMNDRVELEQRLAGWQELPRTETTLDWIRARACVEACAEDN